MAGNYRPAGTELLPPDAVRVRYRGSPVLSPGKKHSIMAETLGLSFAHVTSRGPPLKRSNITGWPFATIKHKDSVNCVLRCYPSLVLCQFRAADGILCA